MARKSPAKSVQYSRGSSVTFGQVTVGLVLWSLSVGGAFMLGQMYPRPLLETFRSNVVSAGPGTPHSGPWRPPAEEASAGDAGTASGVAEMPVVPAIEVTAEQVREVVPEVTMPAEPAVERPLDPPTSARVDEVLPTEARVVPRATPDVDAAASATPVAVIAPAAGGPRAVDRTPSDAAPSPPTAQLPSEESEPPRVAAAPARGRAVARQPVGAASNVRAVEVAATLTADDAERIRQRLRDLGVVARVHASAGGGFQLIVEGVTSDDEALRLQRLGRQAADAN